MHRCRSRYVHVQFACRLACTFPNAIAHITLSLPSFLSSPLRSLSLSRSFSSPISVFPVTKGVFLFKGPQKTLGTKSRNCYNWQKRDEAFGMRNSHIPIMLTEIWACTISECRQTWQGNYSLLMNSHNMLSAALR